MARVVLVRPPVDVAFQFSRVYECLALGYLASALRQDAHEATLIDGQLCELSEVETARRILDLMPDAVGFTAVLNHFPPQVGRIADMLREGGYTGAILVGGHAVSFFPEAILDRVSAVDGVVCGEGEQAVRHVAAALARREPWVSAPGVVSREGRGHRRVPAVRNGDLDRIHGPARDLIPELIARDAVACCSTSRGCYARCSFCSVPRFYGLDQGRPLAAGSWIARRAVGAVEDLRDLYYRFGVREVVIVDDEFFGGSPAGFERAMDIGRALEAMNMPLKFVISCRAENVSEAVLAQLQRGGLAHVFIGLEAATYEDLKLYAKGHTAEQNRRAVAIVKALGLSFQPGFMLFNHRSTLRQVRANIEFLRDIGECKPVTLNTFADPHFGAPLTKIMESDGVLRGDGLSLSVREGEGPVTTARTVVGMCARAFEPYMRLIGLLQSSVTYEWRRPVPGRSARHRALVNSFEASANEGFASIVVRAVEDLDSADPPSHEDAILDAQARIVALETRLRTSKALLLAILEHTEGRVRRWTQHDLTVETGQAMVRQHLAQ